MRDETIRLYFEDQYRVEFEAKVLRRLYFLSQDIGMELPKGSSPMVEEVGGKLVIQHGRQILDRVAKKHFKLTQRILEAVGERLK